jgi:hypothetical protein
VTVIFFIQVLVELVSETFPQKCLRGKIFEVTLCLSGATQVFGQQFMNSKVMIQEFQ